MKIRAATHKDKYQWNQYVLNHSKGIAYQLYSWKEAVEKAYHFKSCYLIAENHNKITGVFPLITIAPPLMSGHPVSLPYCDAGGPLADSDYIEVLLIEKALGMLNSSKKIVIRSTKNIGGLDSTITLNRQKVRMVLDLPGDSDKLLASLKAKVRSQVKKAYKNGLCSTLGSVDLLDDFYAVFSENMRDLGSPVHSRKWVKSILISFGNRAHVSVVYMPNGEPAAAGIILCHPKLVSIPWASSLRRFNHSNPNMMLYWTFLKFASDYGYPAFDFGRSTPNEGTFRFKKQWGARPQSLHWVYFNGLDYKINKIVNQSMKNDTPGTVKIRKIAEKVIQNTPLELSKAFGCMTRKYITL